MLVSFYYVDKLLIKAYFNRQKREYNKAHRAPWQVFFIRQSTKHP